MSRAFEDQFESVFLSQDVQDYIEKIDRAAFRDPLSPKCPEQQVQMFTLAVFRLGYVKGMKSERANRIPTNSK